MRKENYLISFINKEVMNLKVPFLKKTYLSETLVYNLRVIVDAMFDSDYKINDSFVKNPANLRFYFVKLGLINLFLSPFLAVYILMYTMFKYLAELKNNPKQVLGRRWSLYAKFKFREYHELKHEFERRISLAYGPASDYLHQFPNTLLSIVANRLMFITSAFAGVIILLSYLNNSLTLYLTFFNQNLLTWLTTFLFAWAYLKGFMIDEHAVFTPKEKLDEVCELLHHHDVKWKGKGHHTNVKNEFLSYFIPSYLYFWNEIMSVFFTPLVLLISLPKSAEDIARFVDKVTVDYEGIGHICGHAAFKFNEFGNTMYGSHTSKTAVESPETITEFGKMEMSYLTFLQRYPNYKPKEDNGEREFLSQMQQSICKPVPKVPEAITQPPVQIETTPTVPSPMPTTPVVASPQVPQSTKKKPAENPGRVAFNQMLSSGLLHQDETHKSPTSSHKMLLDSQLFNMLESNYNKSFRK